MSALPFDPRALLLDARGFSFSIPHLTIEAVRATDTPSRHEQMETKFVSVVLRAAGVSRTETFMDRSFRVIPAVMVRSQVLHNNLGVCFLPPGDVTDEWASLWNGIPVLVGSEHPTLRGVPCSGRDSNLWNERLGVATAVSEPSTTQEAMSRVRRRVGF